MKVNRTYSLDIKIVEKLCNESNASALIEKLVKQHYDNDLYRKMTKEEGIQLLPLVEQKEKLEAQIKEKVDGILTRR